MASHLLVNVDQAEGWDGEEGDYWVKHEDRFNGMIPAHSARLYAAANISSGERVLDIGCGCGETTRRAARAAWPGVALGVDLSAHMIARARERARSEGLSNARFDQADAQVQPFEKGAFDVVISRFGVMFFSEPTVAFRNIHSALRPGGRAAFLAWRGMEHSEWIREFRTTLAAGRVMPPPPPCSPGPLGLADPDATRRVLSDAGFADIAFAEFSGPMKFGHNVDDAFNFVRGFAMTRALLSELDPAAQKRTLDELREMLARHDSSDGVQFQSSAWIITARHAPSREAQPQGGR